MNLRRFDDDNARRLLSAGGFAVAIASTRLTLDTETLKMLGVALIGLGVPFLLVSLWGERTRPKFSLVWTIFTFLIAAGFVVGGQEGGSTLLLRAASLAIFVGFFLLNDHPLTPSIMVSAIVLAGVVLRGDIEWEREGEGRAWFLAISVLLGVLSALLERERLQSLNGVPTPWPWTVIRASFIAIWTMVILLFQEQLQVGQLFASVGLDPRLDEGRWSLFAIILICLALAAVLFRTRKPRATTAP
jgi:hypothetical protein